MKTNKTWAADETAIIYKLLVFGYSNKEIISMASFTSDENLLRFRTPDSISSKCSEVRKYIIKDGGGIVENYDLSGTIERRIAIASNKTISQFWATYMPEDLSRLSNSPANAEQSDAAKPRFTRPEDEQIKPPYPLGYFDKKPDINISDVMRMAKELGAVEVEYSGVKIKF